jgi:hypothetical protein
MSFGGLRAGLYFQRAAEVRAVAETCRSETIKEQLETVAREYEALARSVAVGMFSR